MPMNIKKSGKPHIVLTKVGSQGILTKAKYDILQRYLNDPLPVNSISYLSDGSLSTVSVFLPGTKYVGKDGIEHRDIAVLFNDNEWDGDLV